MSETPPNLFSHLGKPVKDEQGRIVGTMASFLVTPGGRIDGVFIEHGDGDIKQYSSDQITKANGEVILSSELKMKASNFCNQIPLLWRKTQAIRELNEKQKIPDDMYDGLYSSFEGALNQLKTEAETTIADVDEKVAECNTKVKELNSALINLEIEREIGQINDESYQAAIQMVKEGIRKLNAEKEDFEALKQKLNNLCLGEELKTKEADTTETADEVAEAEDEEEEVVESPTIESVETSLPEPPETPGEKPVVVTLTDDQLKT
jgi:hypothetical protein